MKKDLNIITDKEHRQKGMRKKSDFIHKIIRSNVLAVSFLIGWCPK